MVFGRVIGCSADALFLDLCCVILVRTYVRGQGPGIAIRNSLTGT